MNKSFSSVRYEKPKIQGIQFDWRIDFNGLSTRLGLFYA